MKIRKNDEVYEFCPECESEVVIEAKFEKHQCPSCNRIIYPCALCLMDDVDCTNCPIKQN